MGADVELGAAQEYSRGHRAQETPGGWIGGMGRQAHSDTRDGGRLGSPDATAPMSVGQLLQCRRMLARLTQEELAERSGYSTDYVSKLERDQRRPPRAAIDRLSEVLGLGEREREALWAARMRPSPPQRDSYALSPNPLPSPPTPLIGRAAEREVVHKVLGASRLVTLTGMGGTGKTRLALAVAHEVAAEGQFADGVAFVDLAPLPDPSVLAYALVGALGLRDEPSLTPETHLIAALHTRHILLVIDNLEHVVIGASLLSRLLAAAPQLHILATSRIPLRLYGEQEVRVPPLPVPPATFGGEEAGAPALPYPTENEAVQLFIARARAVQSGFDPKGASLEAVAAVCIALDGLPLAIELAAARVRYFPPEALQPQLGERLALATGGPRDLPARQHSMRATLDWSYSLLTSPDQSLFPRLSVFAGSFDAVAAGVVCNRVNLDDDDAANARRKPESDAVEAMLVQLGGLTEQSLVEVIPGQVPRFRLLQTVRAYALDRLVERGEEIPMREWHLHYYVALVEDLCDAMTGPKQGEYLAQLEQEHDNLRVALNWALQQGDALGGLRLAGMLGPFWRFRGHFREGLRWLEATLALQLDDSGAAARSARARALTSAGYLARRQSDYKRATARYGEALDLYRAVDDPGGIGAALTGMGNVAYALGQYTRATSLHAEALSAWRGVGRLQGVSIALGNLGRVAFKQGDDARAQDLLEKTLTLKRQLADPWGIAGASTSLARIAIRRGDYGRATNLLEESLALKATLGDKHGRVTALSLLGRLAFLQGDQQRAAIVLSEGLRLGWELGAQDRMAEILESLATVAAADGQPHDAVRLGAAAAALREDLGLPLSLDQQASHDRLVLAAQAALGEDDFTAVWTEGLARPVSEAVASVLDADAQNRPADDL